jgi:hypothetical protein
MSSSKAYAGRRRKKRGSTIGRTTASVRQGHATSLLTRLAFGDDPLTGRARREGSGLSTGTTVCYRSTTTSRAVTGATIQPMSNQIDAQQIQRAMEEQHAKEAEAIHKLTVTQQARRDADATDAAAWKEANALGLSTRQLEALGFTKPGAKPAAAGTGKRRGRRKATDSLAAVG